MDKQKNYMYVGHKHTTLTTDLKSNWKIVKTDKTNIYSCQRKFYIIYVCDFPTMKCVTQSE